MPLEIDDILGACYLDPAQFLARAKFFGAGVAISGMDAADLKPLAAMASRAVDAYCGREFTQDAVTETHRLNPQTRRFSVNQPPVAALQSYKLVIGPGQFSDVSVSDVYVNNQENYLELVGLSQAAVLTPEMLTLGLSEVQVEVTYKTYQSIPPHVAAACGFVMAKMANMGYVSAQVPDGIQKAKLGGLDVTRAVFGANDSLDLPPMARQLLASFRRIAIG